MRSRIMYWIAPSEKDTDNVVLEKRLWNAALLMKFCELADTFEPQGSHLQRQIQNLRRTRDLLLPRLLSGQVELSTAEVSA